MTATRTDVPIVISAWSTVSPHGVGRAAYAAAAGSPPAAADDFAPDPGGPIAPIYLVPDFDARSALGRKGTRSMDRASALAVTGVRELLGDGRGDGGAEHDPRRTACVLATTTGSVHSMMDFTRDSVTGERPYLVDPARFPNTVMNCAAGLSAIWHDLQGPNATIAGGRVAGLHALNYSRRLIAADRAAAVLCGAVEEYSATRSWLEHQARGDEVGPGISEGCTVLRVEPALTAADSLAEIAAVRFNSFTDDARSAVAGSVRDALDAAGVAAADVWRTVVTGAPGALGRAERDAVAAELGADPIVLSSVLGDSGAASVGFAIADLLTAAAAHPVPHRRAGLVVATDREGIAGAAVIVVPAAGDAS